MKTKKQEFIIPFILTTIFVVTSFMPVLQIVFLTLIGGMLSFADEVLFGHQSYASSKVNLLINLPIILGLLLTYIRSKNKVIKIVSASLSMIFLFALFYFLISDNQDEDKYPYYLFFMVYAILSGVFLMLATVVKVKMQHRI